MTLALSQRFADGHRAVLRAAGITNLTSFNTDWMGDPDAVLFLLTCEDDATLLSGMRLQRRGLPGTLPLERAIAHRHPEITAYLDARQEEGCGEFCALWSRREAAVAGIGMLPMSCVGLGLMPQLGIRHGFAFMGINMRPIQRELGFTILEEVGVEGQFDYPRSAHSIGDRPFLPPGEFGGCGRRRQPDGTAGGGGAVPCPSDGGAIPSHPVPGREPHVA